MTNEIQKKRDDRIKQKDARYNKVELSIEHRWAVNSALSLLFGLIIPAEEKWELVKQWTEKIIEYDRNYMLESMPSDEQLEDERPA